MMKVHDQKQLTKQRIYFGFMVPEQESVMVGKAWRLMAKLGSQDITCSTANKKKRAKWSEAINPEIQSQDMYFLWQG